MQWRGVAAVSASAALWGVAGVVAKALFEAEVSPLHLVEVRLTGSLPLVALLARASGRRLRLTWADARRLAPLGLAMVTAQSMYYLTISLADVTTAIFLQYTAPALVLAYTVLVQRERLTAASALAVAGALTGAYLLVVGPRGLAVTPAALLTGIASAAGFAGWILIGRWRGRGSDPWTMVFYATATGAVIWSLIVPPWRAYAAPYTPDQWALVAFIVVFATVLPFALFLYGLRFIDSRTASLTATVEPVVAAVAAAVILAEVPVGREWAGAGLILASVLVPQVRPPAGGPSRGTR